MAATMRDVARKAGVSINTVSRVVNNNGEVSAATRQRILRAIEELGFRPNVLARGLVSGKSLTVALIIPQITDPFFPDVVLGVESVARQHGYSVLLCNTNDDPQQELDYVDVLVSKQVDGIILCGSRLNEEQLERVAALHRMAILTSRNPRSAAVISVRGREGLATITDHLLRLGHQRIGHIGWPSPTSGGERAEGYRQAMHRVGLTLHDHWQVVSQQATIASGREAGHRLLHQASDLTAVTCFNDLIAIGLIQACADVGKRVPEDLAVVGFDDIPLASLVTPALTTMRVPRFRLGQMITEMLLRVIAADGAYSERLYVEPELVVRSSRGANRHAPQAAMYDTGREVMAGNTTGMD